MHVVVIGAGVIGVTTAYYLSELGCQVTVVDRHAEVADGASFGNAGQLSYSFTDAMATPAFLAKIPGILLGRDSGIRVRPHPALLPWGLRFLAECTRRRARENTVTVLKIALRSAQLMADLEKRLPFDFSHRDAGKMVLLDSEQALRNAEAGIELKRAFGCVTEVLTREAAIAMEPAIAEMPVKVLGAVYSRHDSVGDSRKFAMGLKQMLEKSGNVHFRLGTNVKRLVSNGSRIKGIELDDSELRGDAVVVCAGAWSSRLLKPVAVNPYIVPVRGYSVTLPLGSAPPAMSVTVLHKKAVFSRLNGALRIAGFADFLGFSERHDARRVSKLLELARDVAPLAADYGADGQSHWGGFRPMTPNGVPWVGSSRVGGLFLNTGHGSLGWTLACASSHDIAQSVVWSLR
ncbi:MAG: FAD-dependent oxidoreductase [Woeseiaceae bacterium]